MKNFFQSVVDFFKQVIVEYGLGALLILAACLLGFLNIGLIFGMTVSDKILFLAIAVIFIMFYMPKLWGVIWGFLGKIWRSITGANEQT